MIRVLALVLAVVVFSAINFPTVFFFVKGVSASPERYAIAVGQTA